MSAMADGQRNWNSVRLVIEAMALAALLWSARTQVETQTQIAVLQENVLAMRAQLADVPGLIERVTKLEVQVDRNSREVERNRR